MLKIQHFAKPQNVDDILELVREPNNKYDKCAIAVHWHKKKIGFIPASENKVLSQLLDSHAIELMAEITHVEQKASTWENIHISVYFLKKNRQKITTANAIYEPSKKPKLCFISTGRQSGLVEHIGRKKRMPIKVETSSKFDTAIYLAKNKSVQKT